MPSVREAEAAPSLGALTSAAWRQENLVGSFFAREWLTGKTDPDFDVWEFIPEEFQTTDLALHYTRAHSQADAEAITRQIRRELADRETLARGGVTGFLTTAVVGGLLDPLNLAIPGPALIRSVGKGAKFGANFLKGAAYGAGAMIPTEAALLATQETRTPGEAALNVSTGAMLVGLMQGGAGALIGRAERRALVNRLDAEINRGEVIYYPHEGGVEEFEAIADPNLYGRNRTVIDTALERGTITPGMHRILSHLVDEVDSEFDLNSRIEFVDAVRWASDEVVQREGLTPGKYRITGEAETSIQDGFAKVTLRFFKGADADTAVHEWYHRYWEFLGERKKAEFERYHASTKSKQTVRERFADEGRDFFFSKKWHEPAGGIKSIFEGARDVLLKLLSRIRKLRKAKIPREIRELYEDAGSIAYRLEREHMAELAARERATRQPVNTKRFDIYEGVQPTGPVKDLPKEKGPYLLEGQRQGGLLTPRQWISKTLKGRPVYIGEDVAGDFMEHASAAKKAYKQGPNKGEYRFEKNAFAEYFPAFHPRQLSTNRGNPNAVTIDQLFWAFVKEHPDMFPEAAYGTPSTETTRRFMEMLSEADRPIQYGAAAQNFDLEQTFHEKKQLWNEMKAYAPEWFGRYQKSKSQDVFDWYDKLSAEKQDGLFDTISRGKEGQKFVQTIRGIKGDAEFSVDVEKALRDAWSRGSAADVGEALRRAGFDDERIGIMIEDLYDYTPPTQREIAEGGVPFQMRREDLEGLPSKQVKALAKERGIPVGDRGKKALIEAIVEQDEIQEPSYQMRSGEEVYREVLERADEGLDGDSRLAPIRFLPKSLSESVLRYIEHVHPGARPFVAKYSEKAGSLAEGIVITWENLAKNAEGKATRESAEIIKRRHTTRFKQRMERAINDGFVNLMRRERGEGAIPAATVLQTARSKFNIAGLREFRRQVGAAIHDLEAGRDLFEYGPEVQKAAREIGGMTNEIGRMAAKHPQLLGEKAIQQVEAGRPHFARKWNYREVMKHPSTMRKILKEEFPEADADTIEKIMDSITGSPFGDLDKLDLSQAIDMDNIDGWTADYFKHNELNIDYRRLVGVDVGNGKTVDFIDLDAARMFERYADSVMGPVALAEKFGDPSMKTQIKAVWNEYAQRMQEAFNDKDQTAIRKERDKVIKDLIALRDLVAGNYQRFGGMPPGAMRVSRAVLAANTMFYLGGVVLSSLGDIARPMFHWGLQNHTKALMDYASIFRSAEWKALNQEARDVWGAAISVWNSERFWSLMDFHDDLGDSIPERAIRFMNNQMGFVTGIDAWNAKNKQISMYVALQSVTEIAAKIKASGAKTIDEAVAAGINQGHIRQIANMGLSIEDLAKVADQVAKHGEQYEKLTLTRVDRWDDVDLANKFQSAMVKEIDATIVTPSVGDKPLWMNNGLLMHAAQFKAFSMAAMRGVVIKGMQEADAQQVVSVLAAVAAGAGVYSIKQAESGREITDNPAEFLLNAIDRGGLTAYFMDVDSMLQRASFGKVGLQAAVGGEGASRFASKSMSDVFLGPSGGTFEGALKLGWRTLPRAVSGEMTRSDITPIKRLTPYGKAPWWRWAMERYFRAAQDALPARLEEE